MFRFLSASILAVALLGAADKPNRDIQELQRDIAQLQETIKNLQRSLDDKLGAIQAQVQKSADSAAQANAAVGAVQQSLDQGLKNQEGKLVPPVTAMTSRMDGVSSDLRTLQTAVSDLAGVLSKMQTQMSDLNNAVKVSGAPPAAPPPGGTTSTTAAPGATGAPAARPETPPISASDLFANADRDRIGGKLDLAQQEFSDYLRWYGDTPQAPMAQYLIASIYYSQSNYEGAIKEFDNLIQNFPASNRIPDAMYYKGQSLVELGRSSEAAETIRELKRRFPNNEFSKKPLAPRRG